tara:strand:+ start:2737 stop:3591 length:855 start_codon:yes stop_codon:yes gene_type:complete
MNLDDSNNEIIQMILSDIPFIISRFGWGPETHLCYNYYIRNTLNNVNNLNNTLRNCGIYSKNNDIQIFEKYFAELNNSIQNSNALVCFENTDIDNIQNYYCQKYNIKKLNYNILDPLHFCNNEIPWTHYLNHKKVLIINPFIDSMKHQLNNNFQLFKDKKLFLDDQEFIFYKTFQTHGNNYIHENWLETFEIMCNDIDKLDFDIALIACGGYGLLLCNFIKKKMNKSAIYVGGKLQLYFGVMGNRWINRDNIKQHIKENNTNFIQPSGDELLPNRKNVEGGCYW